MIKYKFNLVQLWIFGITCMLYGFTAAFSLWIPAIILAVIIIAILIVATDHSS